MSEKRTPIAKALGVPDDVLLMPGELDGMTPEQVAERVARLEIAISAWLWRLQHPEE